MFPNEEKLRRLKNLTKKEMEVLFWQVRGLKDPDIAQKLGGIAVKTVADRRTGMYSKLGFDGLKDHEKPDTLVREYSRFAAGIVPDEEALKKYIPTPEEVPPIPTPTPVPGKTKASSRPAWVIPLIIGACLSSIAVVAVLLTLVRFGILNINNPLSNAPAYSPTPAAAPSEGLTQSPQATLFIPAATSTLNIVPVNTVPTSTVATLVINTIVPQSTVTPITPSPTRTPKAFFLEGEGAPLAAQVLAILGTDVHDPYDGCHASNADFNLLLYIQNDSDNQFLVRYNTSSFHAVDDTGFEYQLLKATIDNDGNVLNQDVSHVLSSKGRDYICLAFSGKFPITVHYITLTADWISDVGPIVFRETL